MGNGTREKMKLYGVLMLAVVFVAVGYLRFFHSAKEAVPPSAATPSEMQVALPELTVPGSSQNGKADTPVTNRQTRVIRDIFSPGEFTRPHRTVEATPEPPAIPSFSLKGTIVAGLHPIAVINNRFVRAGDRIEVYQNMLAFQFGFK